MALFALPYYDAYAAIFLFGYESNTELYERLSIELLSQL